MPESVFIDDVQMRSNVKPIDQRCFVVTPRSSERNDQHVEGEDPFVLQRRFSRRGDRRIQMNLRRSTPNLQKFRWITFLNRQTQRVDGRNRNSSSTNDFLVIFFSTFGTFFVIDDHSAEFLLVFTHFLPHDDFLDLQSIEAKRVFHVR